MQGPAPFGSSLTLAELDYYEQKREKECLKMGTMTRLAR